jgi:hypothetical protein
MNPDSPEVPVHRTARGFSIDAGRLREALEGTATAVTFTAPDGWRFGDDRRLHPADLPSQVIAVGDLILTAARLVRDQYDDAVHGEGICREVLARLIAEVSGQEASDIESVIGGLAPGPG